MVGLCHWKEVKPSSVQCWDWMFGHCNCCGGFSLGEEGVRGSVRLWLGRRLLAFGGLWTVPSPDPETGALKALYLTESSHNIAIGESYIVIIMGPKC